MPSHGLASTRGASAVYGKTVKQALDDDPTIPAEQPPTSSPGAPNEAIELLNS